MNIFDKVLHGIKRSGANVPLNQKGPSKKMCDQAKRERGAGNKGNGSRYKIKKK